MGNAPVKILDKVRQGIRLKGYSILLNIILRNNAWTTLKFWGLKIPDSYMKIDEKFGYNKITAGCENGRSNTKYPISKKNDSRFYLINFHPENNAASRRHS